MQPEAALIFDCTSHLHHAGNYKSFGDSKFTPRASPESISRLAKASPEAEKLWNQVKDAVYDTSSIAALHLGYPDDGHVSTYYPDSPDITKKEIELVSDFLKDQSLMPENSRLRKTAAGNFELLIASAVKEPVTHDTKQLEWTLDGELKCKTVKLVYGDHAKEMVSSHRLFAAVGTPLLLFGHPLTRRFFCRAPLLRTSQRLRRTL